jgi:hypothetical protein
MNDVATQKLQEIITQYGRSVCNDRTQLEGLLRDYCGQYGREIFVIISALREQVPTDLLNSQNSLPKEVLLARLKNRLQANLGLAENVALWAVESWALALGVITTVDVTVPPPTETSTVDQTVTNPLPKHNWLKSTITGGLICVSTIIVVSEIVISKQRPTSISVSISTPISTPIQTPQTVEITSEQAIMLVEKWLSAKQIMYFPPYNHQNLAAFTTGQQYREAIDEINRLQSENGYWKYYSQSIEAVNNFSVNGDNAVIQVTITEDLALYENGEINLEKSGMKTTTGKFSFQFIDGQWKISDRQDVNSDQQNVNNQPLRSL